MSFSYSSFFVLSVISAIYIKKIIINAKGLPNILNINIISKTLGEVSYTNMSHNISIRYLPTYYRHYKFIIKNIELVV